MCVDAGRVVNPFSLGQCLLLLPDHDEYSVHRVLNPDDPQDVPRAIDLIEAVWTAPSILIERNAASNQSQMSLCLPDALLLSLHLLVQLPRSMCLNFGLNATSRLANRVL